MLSYRLKVISELLNNTKILKINDQSSNTKSPHKSVSTYND